MDDKFKNKNIPFHWSFRQKESVIFVIRKLERSIRGDATVCIIEISYTMINFLQKKKINK